MQNKQHLLERFNQTALNFKFKLGEDVKPFFDIIFDQIKHQPEAEIDKKFQQLWLTPIADWNKKYGFGGYPALSDWLEILKGERPLTDEQKAEELRQYENMRQALKKALVSIVEIGNDGFYKVKCNAVTIGTIERTSFGNYHVSCNVANLERTYKYKQCAINAIARQLKKL
jgi:hypothetical protein